MWFARCDAITKKIWPETFYTQTKNKANSIIYFLLVKAAISICNLFEYIFDWFTILILVVYSNYYQTIIMHNANGF